MSNSLISIIIVSAGKGNYLEGCLASVKAQGYPYIETIVIDNSRINRFYCEPLNNGIRQAKGGFVLCLNDDIILDKNFIENALAGFGVAGKIGMVSGKILRTDKKTIDSTGLFLTTWRTAKERGYGIRDCGQFEKPGYIFGVNGAVAFYRKEMLDDIAIKSRGTVPSGDSPSVIEYFDMDFRIFYEDLDVAWRAQNSGWRGYYVPEAIAYHLRGGTVRQANGINKKYARRYLSEELHFELVKNRYLAIIKNENLPAFLLYLPFILVYDAFMWGYILLFRPRLLKNLFLKAIPLKSAFQKRVLIRRKAQNLCNLP